MQQVRNCFAILTLGLLGLFPKTVRAEDVLLIPNGSPHEIVIMIKASDNRRRHTVVRVPPGEERTVRLVSPDPYDIIIQTSSHARYGADRIALRKQAGQDPNRRLVNGLRLTHRGQWYQVYNPNSGEYEWEYVQGVGDPDQSMPIAGGGGVVVIGSELVGHYPRKPPIVPND